GGFLDGEYHAGFYYTAQVLIDTFLQKRPVSPQGLVTLLGDRGANKAADTAEIQQLLDGFGLQVASLFPGRSSIAEMQAIPASALSITLGGKGRSKVWLKRLAVYLETKFAVPFLDKEYPVGFAETRDWLLALGKLLQKEDIAQKAVKIQEKRLEDAAEKYRPYFQGLKTVLCIARPADFFPFAWIFELLAFLNIRLEGVMLFKELTPAQKNDLRGELQQYTAAPILDEQDAIRLMQQTDFLLTTYELETEQKQFYLPVLPPLGIGGVIKVMAKMARLFTNENRRSNVVYGW
ncbi:MAG: nitrogenase component 1, partial [Sporomusaceae bacterium]|nr:nitrogenase component 1 [Sporomusaceae bacterium]